MENSDVTRHQLQASIVNLAWKDEAFLEALRSDAKKAISDKFGAEFAQDFSINLIEEDEKTFHLVIPSHPVNKGMDLSDDELSTAAGGTLGLLLPIAGPLLAGGAALIGGSALLHHLSSSGSSSSSGTTHA